MKNKGILFAFLAVFLWGTLGVGIKLMVSGIDSFIVCIYIGFFATIALLVNLIFKKKISLLLKSFKKNYLFFILAGIIGLGIQQILYLKGYQLLPASQVVILFYIYPLLMVLLSGIIFKEKTPVRSYLFLLMGFFGIYFLLSQGNLLSINISIGIVFVLIASFSWALFSVLIKYKKFDVDSGMFLFNLFGFLFLISLIPFFEFTFEITNMQILGFAYLGVFPTAIAFLLWNASLKKVETHICSNISLLTPFISIILIAIILKEEINLIQIIGLLIIVSSVALNIGFRKKEQEKIILLKSSQHPNH